MSFVQCKGCVKKTAEENHAGQWRSKGVHEELSRILEQLDAVPVVEDQAGTVLVNGKVGDVVAHW